MIFLFLLFNMCSLHAFSNADTTLPRLPKIPQLTKQKVDTSAVYIPKQQVVVTGTRNEVLLKDSPVRVEIVDAKQTVSTAMVNLGDLLREQTGLLLTNNVRTEIGRAHV